MIPGISVSKVLLRSHWKS